MAASSEHRTLLVADSRGMFKITIPADWKVTFGTGSGNRGFGERELRIYEAESKQRACFTNVQWFRDLSIPVEREIVLESGETSWETDENGNTSSTRKTKKTRLVVKEGF